MSDISHTLATLPAEAQNITPQTSEVTQSNISVLGKVINAPANTSNPQINPLSSLPDITSPSGAAQLAREIETVSNIRDESFASCSDAYQGTTPSAAEESTFMPALSDLSRLYLQSDTELPSRKTKNLAAFLRERSHMTSMTRAAEKTDPLVLITTLPSVQKKLTDRQREKINQSTPPDFALLLSCVTKHPVIFLTKSDKQGGKLSHIYCHGEEMTDHMNVDSLSDAIIFTQNKREIVLTIKRSDAEKITTSLPAKDYVALLTSIPEALYRFTDTDQVLTFMSVPVSMFRIQGQALYHDLKDAVLKDNIELICERYKEVSVLESALTGGIAKDSFYQQLFEGIDKKVSGTGKMITFVINNLYLPPAKELKLMTTGILNREKNQPEDTNIQSEYLCGLAEKLPVSRKKELHTAIETIVKSLHPEFKSYVELMDKCKKTFLNMLHRKRLGDETTKESFRYYYDQFVYAVKKTGLHHAYIDTVTEELFFLRGYVDINFPEKLLPSIKESFSRNLNIIKKLNQDNYNNICCLDDRIFSLLIINAYLLPLSAADHLASHFIKIISKLGPTGNIPMATCHLIDYLNEACSTEASKEFFAEKFYLYVKGENRANGLAMIFACNAFLKESEIYNYRPSEIVPLFRNIWNIYHSVSHQPISDNQCVVIQRDRAYIDSKDKWVNNFDTIEVNLTVMSKDSAEKWFKKCEYIEDEIFRHPDAASLFNVILQSLPSHPHRTDISQKIIAAYLTGEKWNHSKQISLLNKYLNVITSKMPRERNTEKSDYASTVLGVTDMQITLLTRYLQDTSNKANTVTLSLTEEIIDSMASNIELIDKAVETKRVIELFKARLKNKELRQDTYIKIINKVISLSLSRNIANEGRILRSQILNSALNEMDNRLQLDNWFLSLTEILTNRPYIDTGFNIFDSLIKSEILHSLPSPLKDKRHLTESERRAFSKFITAQPVNLTLLKNACIDLSGIDLSDKTINTAWVINTAHFFDASAAVQHAMLQLISTVLQEDPGTFIQQCLILLEEQLAQPPSDKIKNMAKSVNAICSFFRETPPADIPAMVATFTDLYLKLQQHDNIQDILPSIQNSLKAMLKEFIRQQYVTAEMLPEQLQPLVIVEKIAETFTFIEEPQPHTASSTSESEARIPKRRDMPSATDTPTSDVASASVRVKQRPASKPVTARTLFCNQELDKLHSNPEVIRALNNALSLFLSDASATQLNLHAYRYKNRQSRFYTFDIKMPDQGWTGRSDHRVMVLKGSDNRYFILGIATHDELKKPLQIYLKLREKQIDEQYFQAADKQLRLNPQTQQPEWVNPADMAP